MFLVIHFNQCYREAFHFYSIPAVADLCALPRGAAELLLAPSRGRDPRHCQFRQVKLMFLAKRLKIRQNGRIFRPIGPQLANFSWN